MKPIIGITAVPKPNLADERRRGSYSIAWNYVEEIERAGGAPVLVPPTADAASIASILDGWLIPGGEDIDPALFGQEPHPKMRLADPSRYEGEARLYDAVGPAMPILGICYGCQFLNVVRGGSLHQHLPDLPGVGSHAGGPLQSYGIDPDSRLAEIIGTTEATGKSYHHQAIDRLGNNLAAVGRHADGTIEAIEDATGRWLFAVQWHPERTPDNPVSQRLFDAFVRAAAAYRECRLGVGAVV